MDAIYSWWTVDRKDRWDFNQQEELETQKKLAAFSNFLMRRQGYKTILYVDELSSHIFKNIPYDEVRIMSLSDLSLIPIPFWSGGKFIAIKNHERPFVHVDFDFFLFHKEIFKKVENSKFFTLNDEPWVKHKVMKNFVQDMFENTGFLPNMNMEKDIFISRNFGVFGTSCPEYLNVLKNNANIILNYVKQNKFFFESNKFQRIVDSHKTFTAYFPVSLEQVCYRLMCERPLKIGEKIVLLPSFNSEDSLVDENEKNINHYTMPYTITGTGMCHLVCDKYKFMSTINTYIQKYNIKY
jgi:hypothetical protein